MVPCSLKWWIDKCLAKNIRACIPIDGTQLPRVVVSILRSRDGVKVEIDTETILACPFNGLEEVPMA